MDVIRNTGHNEIVELTTPVLINCNDGKYRLCGYFRALKNYTKADRYLIPRMPHALYKMANTQYITKMDCIQVFHQNGVKPNSIKLLRIICHRGIYEYTRMPFGIKNSPAYFQRMMDTIFQKEILEGWMVQFGQQELLALGHKFLGLSLAIDQNKLAAELQKPVPKNIKEMQYFLGFASYYRNHIKNVSHISSSLYKLCSKDLVFEITRERRDAYERIKHELTNAPVLILPNFELPFKFYIDAACSQGLGETLHQRQVVDGEPTEGVIFYISRQMKDSEARYGANQTEFLFLFWAPEKLYYYLEGAVFEVFPDCTALKSLLNMKNTNRHMLRWQLAIQEYIGNMTIIYKQGKSHTNADGH
ncbi:hypothetical protein O181_030268 [Austropuccinia psidii MF-1]|uniref:Reverse transcriptase/retrotransposon-derived protein RNase H-like domain-containing protein n=1 Tax=Austropuccinia psidii MF-1 TaxID=1389203 RepID=A0A9Q3H3I9_9BASI|nr:hypothetical protein [Austropuccinia psidii MF-1]